MLNSQFPVDSNHGGSTVSHAGSRVFVETSPGVYSVSSGRAQNNLIEKLLMQRTGGLKKVKYQIEDDIQRE